MVVNQKNHLFPISNDENSIIQRQAINRLKQGYNLQKENNFFIFYHN